MERNLNMKRILSLLLALLLFAAVGTAAYAEPIQSRAVIGADLTEEQISAVYESFAVKRGTVIELRVNNQEERKYLEGYVDNALIYLNGKKQPSKGFMTGFYTVCVVVVFAGALMQMDLAWTIADITMGCMTMINIPCCVMLSGQGIKALRDYEKQKKAGRDPEFHAADIGLDPSKLSFWK